MDHSDWDIFISDDERPVGEDGWSSWDHEPPVAAAHAAKRARREEATGASSCARAGAASVRPDGALVRALTVDDPDALNCGVCFLPLKPPIFQCNVGHIVCSMCCDKLKARAKCHVCGIPTFGYSRCHGMENLLECIRVQCPNAAYGCTTRPAYYDQHRHCQTCPHVPCHCPGEVCSFIGSTAALWNHIAGVHCWPHTIIKVGDKCTVHLRDGFNFLRACGDTDGSQGAKTATPTASNQWLFLVNVALQPLDRVISMICIHPHGNADAKKMQCSLSYSNNDRLFNYLCGGPRVAIHNQSSIFEVACTDLSSGLPDLDECFRFVLPNSVVVDHKEYLKLEVALYIDEDITSTDSTTTPSSSTTPTMMQGSNTSSDSTTTPSSTTPTMMQGPITRARARELHPPA